MAGTASAQGAGEPVGFVPGEATAQANTVVLGLSPGGGKPIEVTLGKSTAHYQNRTATADGAALSLGLLQIFFGPPSACGDRPPIIPADQLPPVSTNDSARNRPMTTPLEVRSPGDPGNATTPGTPGGVIGTQIANATAQPQSGVAATTTVSQDYGVAAIDNGTTSVTTQLVGGVRMATAVTTATRVRILGDMVVINSPRWEATTSSGGTETATASFTFASATILGIERTAANFPGDFNDFANGVAGFLSGLGVTLQYPQVVTEPGKITMTPLVLGLAKPPIGLDFIKPLLKQLAPLKDENTRNLIAEDCNNEAVLQVVDLVMGILSGSGSLTLGLGGVSAFTAATEFPEPAALEIPDLGALSVPDSASLPPPVVGDLSLSRDASSSSTTRSSSVAASPVGPLDDATVLPAPLDTVPIAAPATPPPVAEQTFELPTAALVSRRFEPGSRGGAAAILGASGLMGLLVLAGADRFVMKRTKREIPD